MRCAWCRRPLEDVHGHGACLNGGCPMFGLNQAECCSGEQAEDGWVATSDVAAGPGDGAGCRVERGAAGSASAGSGAGPGAGPGADAAVTPDDVGPDRRAD